MPLKVMTDNIHPPIPTTEFDWVAYFDGYEESGPHANGPTEQIAVERLMRTQGMTADGSCKHCGKMPETVRGCAVGGCPIGEDA